MLEVGKSELALWVTGIALKADGQVVAALTVNELEKEVRSGGNLSEAIENMQRFDRKSGDFGVEFVGVLLVPVLVEAAKQLWSSYLKQLTEPAGIELAELTVEGAKELFRRTWSREPEFAEHYAGLVRAEAKRQGLSAEQTERLTEALMGPRMKEEFESDECER